MSPAYRQARALLEVGRDDQAETTLRTALTGTPGDADLLTLLAFTLRKRGDLPGSLRAADAVLAAGPESADAHAERAETLTALLRAREAVMAAEQATRFAPHYPGSHLVLARALSAARRFPEARAAADRALALAPRSAEVLLTVADVARESGRRDDAERAARAALALEPDDRYGRWLLAMLDAERFRVRRSLRTLGEVARDNPARPDVLSMTWPIRGMLSALRRWLAAALVLACAAAVLARQWAPAEPASRVLAGLFAATVAGFWLRLLIPAGRTPWRCLRLVPRLVRRATLGGLVTVGVQLALLIAYAVTGLWWLTVLAVLLVPPLWALGAAEAVGARLDDPGFRHALADLARRFRELRAELRTWWHESRRSLRDAWRGDTSP